MRVNKYYMCLICVLFVRDNTLSIKTIQKLFLFKMCGRGDNYTFFIPPLPKGGYTVLPLSVCPSVLPSNPSVRPRYFSQ